MLADLQTYTIPTLDDVKAAHARIRDYVRETPHMKVAAVKHPLRSNHVSLKLECMQVTGSFKARGAISKLRSLPSDALQRGIITASGGNHGLGVAYAGYVAQVPATVYISANVPPLKAELLRGWNAEVVLAGDVWDDANNAALERAERDGLTYFHPFADPAVIAGQGTIALELAAEIEQIDTIVVAIGGGGLISGVALTAKALNPNVKIVGIEPVGAPTLKQSVEAGEPIRLDRIETRANTLAPRQSAPINVEIARQFVDQFVLVTDSDMHAAARWLWMELGIAAELSGAAALASLHSGAYIPDVDERVCVLVCGAGSEGIITA